MSRFEAAAKKAATTAGVTTAAPKPKAAASKAAAALKPGGLHAKPKAAAAKLDTLEDKRKFVKMWEMKIDDKDCEVQAEANKKAKKDLETALKKLQTDETYVKVKEEIKDMELQGKRDAERAALEQNHAKTDAKAAAPKAAKSAAPVALEASEAVLEDLTSQLQSTGKDAASAKAAALASLENLSSASAFVLPQLPTLIDLFADSKLGAPAQKAAKAIVSHIQPKGHGIASEVLPTLLRGMQDKRWKVKAACIDVLLPCLHQMFDATPAQLAESLPQILSRLAEAALEVRAEIRSATNAVLREIGNLVASPEIKKLSQDLVTALAEPTNQKHTQDVLARMGNQTFMSLIDAASLSLLMPIVVRGLREREPASKKWSAQIFGSTSQLVQNVDFIKPYLPMVAPMLEQALFDPVSEVKREAAKTFGVMEQVLPEYSQRKLLPWLFGKLRTGEQGEQSIVVEGQKNKHFNGRKQMATMTEDFTTALTLSKEVGEAPSLNDLPSISEAVVRAVMGDSFDAHADGQDEDDEILLRVENLLLMYGAGHLLLKDTTLEMRKNCRYGVVGHNGAGKTTLMKEIAAHRIVGMPPDLKCVHVDDSKLGEMSKSYLNALEYCIKMAKEIGVNDAGRDTLLKVGFDEAKLNDPVSELSTGWRMRLTLAVSMLKHADLVLLDEPTNHLDEESVRWLSDYILSITSSSVMVISHEPKFLNKICTHVVAYVDKKLEYTEGNFDIFAQKKGLSREQIDAMLSGNLSFNTKNGEEEDGEGDAPKVAAPVTGPPKLTFPIPGSMEGVKTGSKSVLEVKHVSFRYSKDKEYLLQDCCGKLSLSSRVAICGRNGCGKSTLMTFLCSELTPSENKDGSHGEVWRHHNLRLAYMKQDHLKALGPFFDTSPFVYITERFKEGYDGDLQRRLIEPEDEEEASRRKELAKQHGKYGNEVAELISRTKVGNHLAYEVRWAGLDDPKQNTVEPISKLKAMGLDKVIIACDERIAAKAAGLDQRPLTRREIVRHCEAFGIDEEMCCNRQIRGFSAGQKVRLSLAAIFWTKPHFIALDEPTNYLDVETVDALGKALTTFRGGIIMIEPKSDFVERICNERWQIEDGKMKVEKLNNGVKRQA